MSEMQPYEIKHGQLLQASIVNESAWEASCRDYKGV